MYTVPAGQSIGKALQTQSNLLLIPGAMYPGWFDIKSNCTIGTVDPTKPYPVVLGGINKATGKGNVNIDGIKFDGQQKSGTGMDFVECDNIKLNRIKAVNFGGNGVNFEGIQNRRNVNNILTNSYIADNFPPSLAKHSEGLYAQYVDGLILKNNVFFRNGGSPGIGTQYNQNCYIYATCGLAIVEENIFAQGSAHGLQQRSGGSCRYNLFVDNPVGMSFGLVNGSAVHKGGVTGTLEYIVYIGGGKVVGGPNAGPRGWALELGQISPAGVAIRNLLIAHDNQHNSAAVHVDSCDHPDNPGDIVSPSKYNLSMDNIWIYDWTKPWLENPVKAPIHMGLNVGKAPLHTPDLRTVIGADYIDKAKADPSKIKQMIVDCFTAVGK